MGVADEKIKSNIRSLFYYLHVYRLHPAGNAPEQVLQKGVRQAGASQLLTERYIVQKQVLCF
jgi:hypothetical protein